MSVKLMCRCGHDRGYHDMGTICKKVSCDCIGFTSLEEKKPSSMRYTCVKLGAGHGVVDTTIDTIICFCSTQEYASSIMGAMNYMEDVSKAQQALSNINTEIWRGSGMECGICHSVPESKDRIRNINLYINGSQGLDTCHACEIIIVNTIRHMMEVSARAKVVGYRLGRKE